MLLFLVLIEKITRYLVVMSKDILTSWRGRNLNSKEQSVIVGMALNSYGQIDISRVPHNSEYTELEVLEIVNGLRKKGYVEPTINFEHSAILSAKGRTKGLELLEAQKQRNT